jgi:hypothetical protein
MTTAVRGRFRIAMKPGKRRIILLLVLVMGGIAWSCYSKNESNRQQVFALEMENALIAEKLFLKLARDEVSKAFPHLEHDVNASGGYGGNQGHFTAMTANDLYFWETVPVADLQRVINKLSLLPDIAEWKSAAAGLKLQRDCKFVLAHTGPKNQPGGRPMIRMLFHESDWPDGKIAPSNAGFWENNWQ